MGFDIFWTGVLQGNPLPEIQARVLWLDPALTVHVDALSASARRLTRDHLFLAALVVIALISLPAGGLLFYYYIWITQRINQDLRLQLHQRLHQLSMRFHAESPRRGCHLPAVPGQRDGLGPDRGALSHAR